MIPLLNGMAQPSYKQDAAVDGTGRQKLVCLHMCPHNLHGAGAFHKLLDHLPAAEHFVLEHGVYIPSPALCVLLQYSVLDSMSYEVSSEM